MRPDENGAIVISSEAESVDSSARAAGVKRKKSGSVRKEESISQIREKLI